MSLLFQQRFKHIRKGSIFTWLKRRHSERVSVGKPSVIRFVEPEKTLLLLLLYRSVPVLQAHTHTQTHTHTHTHTHRHTHTHTYIYVLYIIFNIYLLFLGPHLRLMELLRLGVESEL